MQVRPLNKSLVALAVMAATGSAFADTGFSITGIADVGIKSTQASTSANNKTEVNTNNQSTSLVYIKGFRDLEGGLRASFLLEADFNEAQSTTLNGGTNAQAYTGTPFNGEQFVSLAGGFGEVRLGVPNSAVLNAVLTAEPFGTGMGSAYSSTIGRLGTSPVSGYNSIEGAGASTGRIIRHEKTVSYYTPSLSGFKAGLEYAFGNDANSSPDKNTNTNTTFALQYNSGAFNAMYVFANEKAPGNGSAGVPGALGAAVVVGVPAGTDVTWNVLAANFAVNDALTLMGGFTKTMHNVASGVTPSEDSNSWNLAAKYVASAKFDLLGNYTVRNSNVATANPNAYVLGLGVNYNMDKQTNLYARYEAIRWSSSATVNAADQAAYAIGVRYLF